jgi:hypothetical protein
MKKKISPVLIIGLLLPIMLFPFFTAAQKQTDDLKNEHDTLKEHISTLRDKTNGIEERLATAEADLAKLTKIKLSGYIQAQWQHFEAANVYPSNYWMVRRARFKLQYEPVQGVVFALQPDFQPGNFAIKEAYAKLNDPWLKTFSFWAGKFNRPNYEVEYSSSDLEALERSRVITSLYPGEYAIGAKLEVTPPSLPLKFQLAMFNGNDGLIIQDASGVNINPDNKGFSNYKDIMARLTYSFRIGHSIGLTVGTHGYAGALKATTDSVLKSDYTMDKAVKIGDALKRNWFGVEAQFYADVLGGLILKGEYLMGVNAYPGYSGTTTASSVSNSFKDDTLTVDNTITTTKNIRPNIIRNFTGYYIYLIKNIGKRNQFTIRYDRYDPNTKLNGSEIGIAGYPADQAAATKTTTTLTSATVSGATKTNTWNKTVTNSFYLSGPQDMTYSQVTLCWSYYFDDNIKISLAYDIPMNERIAAGVKTNQVSYSVNGVPGSLDYSNLIKQNILTLRFQAKF